MLPSGAMEPQVTRSEGAYSKSAVWGRVGRVGVRLGLKPETAGREGPRAGRRPCAGFDHGAIPGNERWPSEDRSSGRDLVISAVTMSRATHSLRIKGIDEPFRDNIAHLEAADAKYLEADLRYAQQVKTETGDERSLEVDQLAELAASGHADVAAPLLATLLTTYGLDEDSLAYSRIAHQAGTTYRAIRGGSRRDALQRAIDLLQKAHSSKKRRQHIRASGETALNLGLCYRDLAEFASDKTERARLLLDAERCIQESSDRFERLGRPGAFLRASAIQSLGNLAVQQGDLRKSQRLFAKAVSLITDRVSVLGWNDHACENPRRLYAQVLCNSQIEVVRTGEVSRLRAALVELELAVVLADEYPLHFMVAVVRSKLRDVDQRNLDRLASMESLSALAERDFEQVGKLLMEGMLTPRVSTFFREAIEYFVMVRDYQPHNHQADYTAIRARELARCWAVLAVSSGQHSLAFCVLERVSAMRMQSAARLYEWRPKDADQDRVYFDYTAKGELAATFAGWADMVSRIASKDLAQTFLKLMEEKLSGRDLEFGDDAPVDPKNIRAEKLLQESWARLHPTKNPADALRRLADKLFDESKALRCQLEADEAFVMATGPQEPIDNRELRRLLRIMPDTAFMRIEHIAEQLLVLYVDLVYDDLRAVGFFADFVPGYLDEQLLSALRKNAELPPEAISGLERIDIACGLPVDRRSRVILLPSTGLNLLPLLAMGPAGGTLLDRFQSVSFAWSLAPLRVRLLQDERRTKDVFLYPGRDRPFHDSGSTVFHFVAESAPSSDESVVLGPNASREDVVAKWRDARVVSFYGHGAHVQMGSREGRVGPRLQVGLGETLGIESLSDVTMGLDRAELWACESGVDFPWNPMFPRVADGFGLDYELSRCGVLGVIATQWEVSELATSFIVLKYRLLLSDGCDASEALCGAQRWWRDVAAPSMRSSDDWIDAVIHLWSGLVDRDKWEESFRTVRGFLQAQSPETLAAIRSAACHPLAHAAYRFSGLCSRMPGRMAAEAQVQVDEGGRTCRSLGFGAPSDHELVRLSLPELRRLRGFDKKMSPPYRERFAYHHNASGLLGVVTEDETERDFGFVLLSDPGPDSAPLAFDLGFDSAEAASAQLLVEIQRRLEPSPTSG